MRAFVVGLCLGLVSASLVGCGDDGAATGPTDSGTDTVEDAVADIVPDASPDLPRDGAPDADTGDADAGGSCPGTISCFDPELDRRRASICIQAGFPTGTACETSVDGLDACCIAPFACDTDQDCEDARLVEGFCPDDRYDCVCNAVDGSCAAFVCLADTECEGDDVCRSGNCVPAGDSEGLVARIVSPGGVIREAATRQLIAVAVDPSDPNRVFENVAIDWSTDASESVAIDVSTGLATGGMTTGGALITARVADNGSDPGDSIALYNYADSEALLRVLAIDESSRAPIEGATVYVVPSEGDAQQAVTDADGSASFASDLTAPWDVTVLSADHAYVTHVAASGDDLLVSLSPVAFAELSSPEGEGSEDRICQGELCYDLNGVGAVTGAPDLSQVANLGEIEVGLAGFSLGNALLDLNFELIVGPNVERDLSGGPIPVEGLTEIPGGVTLAFNEEPLVGTYVITATPGRRIMWSLGGRVSLSENPTLLPDIISQLDGELQVAQIISIVLPLFEDFYSGIDPSVPVRAPEGETLNLIERDLLLAVPVSRRVFITPPSIPSTVQGPLETGVFLAGASVPGQGFLPLGITAAADGANDTPLDGVLDGDTEDLDVDPVSLNLAPIHGGIRSPGTQYVLVSVALPLDESGGSRNEDSSGLITRIAPGEPFPESIDFEVDDFPAFPEGSGYELATRTVTIVPNDGFSADFYRVLFDGDGGHNWQVHLPADVETYTLPVPADVDESFEDRGQRNRVSLLSVALDESTSYGDLLGVDGATLDNLVDYVTGFAVLQVDATLPPE